MKTLTTILVSLLVTAAVAQVSEHAFLENYATTGEQEFFYRNSEVTSGSYTYVAGASLNSSGDYDMLLTKFQGSTEVWSVTWDGAAGGDDYAASVIVDGSGYVLIAGTSYVNNDVNYDAIVVKYNSSGTLQWDEHYAGGSGLADGFVSLGIDVSNNVYACGGTITTTEFTNFLTVKYSATGVQQWASTYDYNDLQDVAVKVMVGSSIRVSGGSQYDADEWELSTVSYNASTGSTLGSMQTGGDSEGVDFVTDAWTDGTNSYVVGGIETANELDWIVIKLDEDLEILWTATYNGSDDLDDVANSLAVDASGNVFVSGYETSSSEGKNYVTRKYNSSGTLIWSSSLDKGFDDEALSMELDNSGDVIVTGSSFKDGNLDFLTVKYKAYNGTLIWETRFNSDSNATDIPSNIAISPDDEIYVIGTMGNPNGVTKYILCEYFEKDVYMPDPVDGFPSQAYIQNRGQLRNSDSTSNTAISQYCERYKVATYLTDTTLTYQLSRIHETLDDSLHRVDMKFNKGDTDASIYPFGMIKEYANYYMGYMSDPAERVPYHNSVIKFDAYTNTDVIFSNNDFGFRHWIIAKSGAPTASFEMEFSGQDTIVVNSNGDLKIATSLDSITIEKPNVYVLNHSSGILTALPWQPDFNISAGNKVSFTNFGSWSGTLVIELQNGSLTGGGSTSIDNLDWSTYLAFPLSDWYYSVDTYNSDQYACGAAMSASFLTHLAAEQATNLGDINPVWNRYNEDHQLQHGTYYGGIASEGLASDIVTFPNEDYGFLAYVVGYTNASDLPIQTISGADNDDSFGGTLDGFIACFDGAGILRWSRFIGGNGDDRARGIYVDGTGFFLCGTTDSNSGFPLVDPGAPSYFEDVSGSKSFIMKIDDGSLTIDWSTLYGGNSGSTDARQIMRESPNSGDIWISGTTTDSSFPTSASTGFSSPISTYGGNQDDFLIRFDDDQSVKWSSYIGGSGAELNSGGSSQDKIAVGTNGRVMFTGTTASTDLSTVYNSITWDDATNDGSFDGYLIEFDESDMSVEWATYFGGSQSDEFYSCEVGDDNSLYISGLSRNEDLTLIDDPGTFYNQTSTGGREGFLLRHTVNRELDWFTYWGGTSYNQGEKIWDLAIDDQLLYMVGICDQELLSSNEDDEAIPLVDFGNDAHYHEIYGGGTLDPFISMFSVDLVTGVGEILSEQAKSPLLIFPNPVSDNLTFVMPNMASRSDMCLVYDASGRLVMKYALSNSVMNFTMDVSSLSSGLYTLVVEAKSDNSMKAKFYKE